MPTLSLYLDPSCPWSYLALVRMQDVSDRNATPMELKPVLVDQVLATENPSLQATRLADNPAKAAWQRTDLDYWARLWGLSIQLPVIWPFDAAPAAAALQAAIGQNKGLDYGLALYRAGFAEGGDLTDADVLTEIAEAQGLDTGPFGSALAAPATNQQIARNTEELVRRGGFGTPSVYVNDQLFFGNDRIPLVDWVLGPISDESFVMPGQHEG